MGHIEVVRFLLEQRVSGLAQSLLHAASNGHNEVGKVLMDYGADPQATVYCYSPIEWAPPRAYNNLAAKLPTCEEFAKLLIAEHKKAVAARPQEEYKYKEGEIPGMGLLEEEPVGLGVGSDDDDDDIDFDDEDEVISTIKWYVERGDDPTVILEKMTRKR
jgi:hypothetical protein